ncbi:BTB/POZ domain-containing protein POB1-like [Bidens hawaiensis]|uniref:BTB/POZ domain-containing protein POB1-like n=1 Tax=Bidens hawaiensis TaxID=980011 RepID=UPI00404A65AD
MQLFSNEIKESEQCHATLRINASDEVGLMELLKFMYSNNLTATTALAVLDLLLVAEKFDVPSCTRYCGRLLRTLPMTPEFVLAYLDLPSTILTAEAFQPVTVAAKQFYSVHFKDITKFQDEILSLPLAGVEALIASDDLQLLSENTVYRFVLKWAYSQYPKLEDCRNIIDTRLAKFIRYPYMSHRLLKNLLIRKEFDPESAQKVVTEALSFKSKVPYKQHAYIVDENSNLSRRFVERVYKYRPIKMVEFQQPLPHCVVYLELKRDLCVSLFPSGLVYSEAFDFGDQLFVLMGRHYMDNFELFLVMLEEADNQRLDNLAFDYEFSVRYSMHAQEFVSEFKRSYKSAAGKTVCLSLFTLLWTSFIGEDSVYFVDDTYHFSVELTDGR